MNNELRKIVEQRLKNAKANALAVGTETVTGKMFTGKAELLESILDEYVALPIHGVSNCAFKDELLRKTESMIWFARENYNKEYYEGVLNAMRNMQVHINKTYKKHCC